MSGERVQKEVPQPPSKRLASRKFWVSDEVPNVEAIRDYQRREGLMRKEDVLRLCTLARMVLMKEENVLTVEDPATVCGDIHGQYFDMLKLFELGGKVGEETSYLFLGDYVDRGSFGCEVVIDLFAMKLRYPMHVFLLRGNHECRHLTDHFNFRTECLHKYDESVYNIIMRTFDALPLAAVLGNKFFCVHGGISPEAMLIDEINGYKRDGEPPPEGLLCDLLWSDPHTEYGLTDMKFCANQSRGCSWSYGYRAVVNFLRENELLCVVRGHEAKEKGYKTYKKHPTKQFPSLITIFSAANYIDSYKNKGACILYRKGVLKISTFTHVEHPYVLPDFLDAFAWSLPFVIEKSCEFISTVYSSLQDAVEDEEDRNREVILKRKISAIGKIGRMYTVLREERTNLDQLKVLLGSDALPSGLLLAGPDAISDAVEYFEAIKKADLKNEKRPKWPESLQYLPLQQVIKKRVVVRTKSGSIVEPTLEVS